MAVRVRQHDWSKSSLGPIETWPDALRTALNIALNSGFPTYLAWGPELISFYNDAYMPILGGKPDALGRRFQDVWSEVWDDIGPLAARAMAGDESYFEDLPLTLQRNGFREEAWFTFSYSPIRMGDGGVGGVLCTVLETTDRVIGARRLEFLNELRSRMRGLTDPAEVMAEAAEALGRHLGVGRAGYCEVDEVGNTVTISRDWTSGAMSTAAGRHGFEECAPAILEELRGGRAVVLEDAVRARPTGKPGSAAAFSTKGVGAGLWAPLVRSGQTVAVVFVQQQVPRRWPDHELALLEEVTQRIWEAVGQARAEVATREGEAQLKAAIGLVGLSLYVWHPRTGALQWDSRIRAIWGVPPEATADEAVWMSGIHPEDRERVAAEVERSSDPEGNGVYAIDYRVISASDGVERWVSVWGQTYFEAGEPVRHIGAVLEISERKRDEERLRRSEERFRLFAASSTDVLWIRHAKTWAFEYVSPAVQAVYGVLPDAVLADERLLNALVVPEERDRVSSNVKRVSEGEVVVQEYRIQRPTDLAFRWIRSTGFPLHGRNGRVERTGTIAQDITEAKLAAEHSAVLLAELQHRVRNIMALLRSITHRTADRAESVPEYRDVMMGRLLAFARVQALLTRTANISVGIASLVRDEVSVQAQHEDQYVLDGPDVALSPKAAEVLTLAIHELATNAVKYGAFSAPDGKVTVRWSTFEKRGRSWLTFDWTEEGAHARPAPAPGAPRRRGFGSELIEGRIPYELRGRGQVTIEPGGAQCHLEFPLQDGASILETGAPQRATVFGGAIDMTGEADLTDRCILVVEDDYYLATDIARALRGAGAEVLGPCATEKDARTELDERRPDAVVVDINLGLGPSFKLAETLKDAGIPFMFTTGYDAEVIPAEFEAVERLQKPIQLRQIVSAVAKLTTTA